MKEEKNIAILKKIVENHEVIIPLAMHTKPDGTFNGDYINEVWDRAFEPFVKTPLWPADSDAVREDPSRALPYLVFIPAEPAAQPSHDASAANAAGQHDASAATAPDHSVTAGSQAGQRRTTILVTHGGGFNIRTGCEGPNPALYFHDLGYNTAILVYRIRPYPKRAAVEDELRAIRLLRSKTEEWGLGPNIIASGYSAGGMLSANAATLYDEGRIAPAPGRSSDGSTADTGMAAAGRALTTDMAADPVDSYSARPDGCIIAYGAMSSTPVDMRFGPEEDSPEIRQLLGENFTERYRFSPEKHITPDTPPMFIWQTLSDNGMHGMRLAWALQEAHVKYELHIFDGAVHGVGLADGENALDTDSEHVGSWARLADEWLGIVDLK